MVAASKWGHIHEEISWRHPHMLSLTSFQTKMRQKGQLRDNKLIWFLNFIKVVPQACLPCLRLLSCLDEAFEIISYILILYVWIHLRVREQSIEYIYIYNLKQWLALWTLVRVNNIETNKQCQRNLWNFALACTVTTQLGLLSKIANDLKIIQYVMLSCLRYDIQKYQNLVLPYFL